MQFEIVHTTCDGLLTVFTVRALAGNTQHPCLQDSKPGRRQGTHKIAYRTRNQVAGGEHTTSLPTRAETRAPAGNTQHPCLQDPEPCRQQGIHNIRAYKTLNQVAGREHITSLPTRSETWSLAGNTHSNSSTSLTLT